jgi:hypothetical protein
VPIYSRSPLEPFVVFGSPTSVISAAKLNGCIITISSATGAGAGDAPHVPAAYGLLVCSRVCRVGGEAESQQAGRSAPGENIRLLLLCCR